MIRRTLAWALLACVPHVAAGATITEVHYVMGTYFRITAQHGDPSHARAALHRCFATARRLDERFSRFAAGSELSRLNATAATQGTVTVSAEMAALLRRALALQAATDGAFDVSVGALTQLWRDAVTWPNEARIDVARRSGGPDAFHLIGTTLLRHSGVQIDLDGIAKGWAVDRCVAQLRTDGIERALLNFGESSLYAVGAPSATPRGWQAELRGLDRARAIGTLTLRDQAVSVSGVFGHARRLAGLRIGHIINPHTGQPLTSPAMAVVVAASATDAEAFSKALLINRPRCAGASGLCAPSRHQGSITGALLVTRSGVHQLGRIAFTQFDAPRPISAAEPLP